MKNREPSGSSGPSQNPPIFIDVYSLPTFEKVIRDALKLSEQEAVRPAPERTTRCRVAYSYEVDNLPQDPDSEGSTTIVTIAVAFPVRRATVTFEDGKGAPATGRLLNREIAYALASRCSERVEIEFTPIDFRSFSFNF